MVASTRPRVSHGGRLMRAAKNIVYSASSRFRSAASASKSRWMSVSSGMGESDGPRVLGSKVLGF